MMRKLLSMFILILLFGANTAAFAYWDTTQVNRVETVTLGEGLSLSIDAEVGPPEGMVLVPKQAVLKPGDVKEITLEYLIRLDEIPEDELELEVLASNVRIDGDTTYAEYIQFNYITSAPNLTEAYARATIKITLNEPATRDIYESIKNGILTFTLNFYANHNIFAIDLDFTQMTIDDIIAVGGVSYNMASWATTNSTPLSTSPYETRLLFPINEDEYTITTTATLSESQYNHGGYGIFFDTYVEQDNAYETHGYVFQFDRGYTSNGAMIIRSHSFGRESNPIWIVTYDQTTAFPSKAEDSNWWLEMHEITIDVKNTDETTREATFYIDGVLLGTFSYEDTRSTNQIHVGFRGWAVRSDFYSLRVQK